MFSVHKVLPETDGANPEVSVVQGAVHVHGFPADGGTVRGRDAGV